MRVGGNLANIPNIDSAKLRGGNRPSIMQGVIRVCGRPADLINTHAKMKVVNIHTVHDSYPKNNLVINTLQRQKGS